MRVGKREEKMNKSAELLIQHLGGPTKTAQHFDCTRAAISTWRKRGIPKSHMMYVRCAMPGLYEEMQKTDSPDHAENAPSTTGEA
jgi:predicted SpoU family rRNA methylase